MRTAYFAIFVASLAIFDGSYAVVSDETRSVRITSANQNSVNPDDQVFAGSASQLAAPDSADSSGKCISNISDSIRQHLATNVFALTNR